jgi:hypothetical protein
MFILNLPPFDNAECTRSCWVCNAKIEAPEAIPELFTVPFILDVVPELSWCVAQNKEQ